MLILALFSSLWYHFASAYQLR